LVEIEKSVSHINNFIRKTEQLEFKLNLQKTLDTSININEKVLIKEGTVTYLANKRIISRSKKKYIILFNDTLVVCHKSEISKAHFILPLVSCNMYCGFNKKLLRITYLEKTFSIFTLDTEWANAIQNAINKVFIILIYYNKQS